MQHQTLINELADIGLKDKALQWFISYLSDRSQQVRVAGSLSEETTCSRGVPQGSVLGPLLFTLYIRALPEIARVPCLMFADDSLLFSSSADPLTSSQELTHAVTNVYNWLDDRGLQMNVKKTQAMFVPACQALSQEDLTLSVFCCDRQLSIVHSYKYLGVVLDSKLTWAPHMEHLIRKVSSKIGVLYRSSKKLSTDAKRQYYLSVIQSDLAYGSNAFYSSLPQSAKRTPLQTQQERGACHFQPCPHGLTQNLCVYANAIRSTVENIICKCKDPSQNYLWCQQSVPQAPLLRSPLCSSPYLPPLLLTQVDAPAARLRHALAVSAVHESRRKHRRCLHQPDGKKLQAHLYPATQNVEGCKKHQHARYIVLSRRQIGATATG